VSAMGEDGIYGGHVERVAPRYQKLLQLMSVHADILMLMQKQCYVLLSTINKSVEI
jgi:hypothetical protein